MNQTAPDYTFGIASTEIFLLLIATFLLGMLLCHVLRKMGLCCGSRVEQIDTTEPPPVAPYIPPVQETPRTPREFPGRPSSGGYTADINSLLRDSSASSRPVPSRQTVYVDNSREMMTTTPVTISPTVLSLGGGRKDDLKKLEGIGPRIEQLLNNVGLQNYAQLAAMTPDAIKPILEAAGTQFSMHDPKSWPYQAELAAKGEWERLKEYQSLLISGKEI